MAFNLNRVELAGSLGRDAELRKAGNSDVLTFSLATSSSWRKDNEWKSKTNWNKVVVWGESAIRLKDLKKGDNVFVEGRLEDGEYEKDGVTVRTKDVVASRVYPIGKKAEDPIDDFLKDL